MLKHEVIVKVKEIVRKDGHGTLAILPARDVMGAHGKTYLFVGFDEIHGYRDWSLFEALAPDPTRPDALTWIASPTTRSGRTPGVPLFDLKRMAGSDPRMLFSWYSADLCTDPAFADLPPEERANPSMASWPDGRAYLEQQRRRLPTHKYRRLHLNLPGAPDGAFLDVGGDHGVHRHRTSAAWRPRGTAMSRSSTCRAAATMTRCSRSRIARMTSWCST